MEIYFETANWMWGLSLIVVTITIHATGVAALALGLVRIRIRLEERHLGLRYGMLAIIGGIAVVGLLLTVLHGVNRRGV